MIGDDAACPSSLRLASGVVLCCSATGLLATFADGRFKRIDLHDRAEEAKLVATLGERGVLETSTFHPGIKVLIDEGIVVAERTLAATDHLGLPAGAPGAPSTVFGTTLPVVIGWLFESCFHASVAAAVERREHLMVVCATSSGVWLAYDDAETRPCIRCALLFDTELARGAAAMDRLASTFAAAAPAETLAVATAWLARWRRADCPLPPPGRALVFDVHDGTSRWESYGVHPSCTCGARQPSSAEVVADLDSRAASRRRFSPVICVNRSAEGLPARAVYRGSRRPWPVSPSDFGVAMAGPPDADVRALAEGIERFCMLHAPPDVRATPALALESARLDDEAIDALLFRSEERVSPGFPFPGYAPSLALDWSWATHATTGRRVLLPTSLVGRVPRGSVRLVHGTSNGYACHRSEDAAARAALLEVIERDAVLLGWYLGRPLPRIELDEDVGVGSRVFAWLATQDIDVPVILMAALLDENATLIAAGAGTSFDEALRRASAELRALARRPGGPARADKTEPDEDAGAARAAPAEGDPRQHQRYFDGAGRQHLTGLAADAHSITATELRARWPAVGGESLSPVLSAVSRAQLDAWLVQRAIPDLFGNGWHVVRALVPGCVELSWGFSFRRLASPRLRAALAAGERLNTVPHPLA